MLTLCALVSLGIGAWAAIEIASDLYDDHRKRRRATVRTWIGDAFWLTASVCIVVTALYALAAHWLPPTV